MNDSSHVGTTVTRLLGADWEGEHSFDRGRSRARLMREYLRRFALWVYELGARDDWPWGDIAARIAPDVHPPQEMVGQVEELISRYHMWPWPAATCRGALHWAALLDAGIELPELPNPYEPLLVMFERGGGFTIEDRFIELDGSALVRQTLDFCRAMTPFDQFSPESLDALDAA